MVNVDPLHTSSGFASSNTPDAMCVLPRTMTSLSGTVCRMLREVMLCVWCMVLCIAFCVCPRRSTRSPFWAWVEMTDLFWGRHPCPLSQGQPGHCGLWYGTAY